LSETAEVLEPGAVSLGLVRGGGGLGLDGAGGGGGARVRVGVGAKQEVGVEGTVLGLKAGGYDGAPNPQGASVAAAGKLSWKMSPVPWFALIAGAGGGWGDTGTALGGDLAMLFSSGRALARVLRPYAGIRGGVSFPVGRDLHSKGGITEELVVPVGLGFDLGPSVRLYVEGGMLNAWSDYVERNGCSAGTASCSAYHVGGYGAIGITFVLGKSAQTTPPSHSPAS
jgi:hypothetical protein